MDSICAAFAENLKRIRKEAGLTQEGLAREIETFPFADRIAGYFLAAGCTSGTTSIGLRIGRAVPSRIPHLPSVGIS